MEAWVEKQYIFTLKGKNWADDFAKMLKKFDEEGEIFGVSVSAGPEYPLKKRKWRNKNIMVYCCSLSHRTKENIPPQ